MGCSLGTPQGKEAILKSGACKNSSFQDTYAVGNKLGEGTFGMVYDCMKKDGKDKTVYAVKMLEHRSGYMPWQLSKAQDQQWQEFAQEFDMLRRMDHPNVVKLHNVFVDRHFLYFVMDKYLNNLITAALPLLKAQIAKQSNSMPSCVIGEITAHMLKSIIYLHDQNIVHRDVKADNYLVDSDNFRATRFKVVLTDLGTARQIEDGVLLKDTVGTLQYWAPEVVARCYSKKVDCWAIGVVLWCMLTLKFPFNTAQEAYTKKLSHRTDKMTSDQFELIAMLLEKNPEKRVAAKLALEHKFVQQSVERHTKMVNGETVTEDDKQKAWDKTQFDDSKEDDTGRGFGKTTKEVSQDVKERRQRELHDAQTNPNAGGGSGDTVPADGSTVRDNNRDDGGDLVAVDKQRLGEAKQYSWWSSERCKIKAVPDMNTDCTVVDSTEGGDDDPAHEQCGDIALTEPSNVEELTQQLQDFGIDTNNFGGTDQDSAKAIKKLFGELEGKECRMVLRGNTVIRIVDLLALRIRTAVNESDTDKSDKRKMLIEFEQTKDGTTKSLNRLPAKMRQAGGSGIERARSEIASLLASKLGTTPEVIVIEQRSRQDQISYQQDSKSYPSLTTVYRKTFFDGSVSKDASPDMLAKLGLPKEDSFLFGNTTYKWCSEEELKDANIKVSFPRRVLKELQHLRPLRNHGDWTETKLKNILQQHSIDVSKFGVGTARSISQFVDEANSGETQFLSDGTKLRRHLDILIVKVKNVMGAYLIETGHSFGKRQSRAKNAFPATKVRPFEDKVWAVRRLLGEVDIPYSSSKIIFGPVRVESQESPSYPGVITVYVKQVVEVQLMEIDVANLDGDGMGRDKWFTQKIGKHRASICSVSDDGCGSLPYDND